MKIIFSILLFLILHLEIKSQDLSGLWNGKNGHSIFILNPTNTILDIEISKDTLITGVIHNYYKKGKYEHIKVEGKINWKDSTFLLVEEEEISHNLNTKLYETCLGRMKLTLTRNKDFYFLNGKWKDNSKKIFRCPTLDIYFEKQLNVGQNPGNSDLKFIRKTDIQKVIELVPDEIDSVKCSVYDNGEIDNDTASVYFNDSLILKKQKLSEKPIEFYISFSKAKQVQKIKLIAENLGSIPPNTALLIITTKKNRYQINISSSFSQNGAVEFFLKD